MKDLADLIAAAAGFLIGAFPVIYYNLVSRGSYLVLRSNLFHTENGVNNFAIWSNVKVEADAVRVLLNGGYFWFLRRHLHESDLSVGGGVQHCWAARDGASRVLDARISPGDRLSAAFAIVVFVLSCFTVSILGATHLLDPAAHTAALRRGLRTPRGALAQLSSGCNRAALRRHPRRSPSVLLLGPLMTKDVWVDTDITRRWNALVVTAGSRAPSIRWLIS